LTYLGAQSLSILNALRNTIRSEVSVTLDYPKVFGTVQVRKDGGRLIIQENPRLLPARLVGNAAVILLAGPAAIYFLLYQGAKDTLIGGASILVGLALLFVFGVAVIALVQLLIFVRFPVTIDRVAQTVKRGGRVHLEGSFKAETKGLGGGETQKSFHVRLAQNKGRALFLWRSESEVDAKEMAALINSYLSGSLSDAEVRKDSFDHVG
jgi:hypothetical protein